MDRYEEMWMNLLRTTLTLGALASALWITAPVQAATYTCDNDAQGYPCRNSNTYNTWGYRYWGGDWHGDDRRSSGDYAYWWIFNDQTLRYYSARAYLANPYFTDPSAWYVDIYGVGSRYLNQNTAPSGWNSVGTTFGEYVGVYPSGTGVAGADAVQLIFSSLAGAGQDRNDAGQCGVLQVKDPEVAAIQQKMLNAVDHYRDVRGSFHIEFANNGQSDDVGFEVSQANKSSFVRVHNSRGAVVEHVSNDGTVLSLYPDKSAFRKARFFPRGAPKEPRYFYNRKCQPVYVSRTNPAGAVVADEVVSPENYAFWLTSSDSKVIRHEKVLGRDASVVLGHHDAYLRDKLGADTFKMWVDDATGVLLKLQGTDGAGRRVYFIDVDDIEFNTGVELRPATDAPRGWKRIAASKR